MRRFFARDLKPQTESLPEAVLKGAVWTRRLCLTSTEVKSRCRADTKKRNDTHVDPRARIHGLWAFNSP